MVFLTVEEVIRINERLVGPGLLRDRGLLESAVERPRATAGGVDAYPDVHTKAAALFHAVASNHAFVDGNKRTAVLATVAFYGFNGFNLDADDADLVHVSVDVAIGNVSVQAIAQQLSKWARPIPEHPDEL